MPPEPAPTTAVSVEQHCRDLLEAAVEGDRSVRPMPARKLFDPHPQSRSSGELVVMANRLDAIIEVYVAAERGRCARVADGWAALGTGPQGKLAGMVVRRVAAGIRDGTEPAAPSAASLPGPEPAPGPAPSPAGGDP